MIRALLSVLILAFAPPFLHGAEPAVYPLPQRMKLGKEYTSVKEVVIRKRNKKSRGSGWEKLPKVSGAYAITITPGKVNVYAQDDTGIFYAKQTISQLLQDVENAQDAHRD